MNPPHTQTAESQAALTPDDALRLLREGNRRFLAGTAAPRSWPEQIRATAEGQHPFAMVLSCIDSRVPSATVFDLGIGDVFVARVAGNVLNEDVLGSMEFACRVAGAKAIVVMGHTACGAVSGAVRGVRLGHLTGLVEKIAPAVEEARDELATGGEHDEAELIERAAEAHVRRVTRQIAERSPVLAEMVSAGTVKIAGAMYDVSTGAVRFL